MKIVINGNATIKKLTQKQIDETVKQHINYLKLKR